MYLHKYYKRFFVVEQKCQYREQQYLFTYIFIYVLMYARTCLHKYFYRNLDIYLHTYLIMYMRMCVFTYLLT